MGIEKKGRSMIKGLLITHGNLGKELIQVAEKILEQKIDLENIVFDWKGDGSVMVKQIENFLARNQKNEVIIFTDMFGGSPANISTHYINPNVEVISGINLPGLLKFLCYQHKDKTFREVIQMVKQEATEGINILSEYLGEKPQ